MSEYADERAELEQEDAESFDFSNAALADKIRAGADYEPPEPKSATPDEQTREGAIARFKQGILDADKPVERAKAEPGPTYDVDGSLDLHRQVGTDLRALSGFLAANPGLERALPDASTDAELQRNGLLVRATMAESEREQLRSQLDAAHAAESANFAYEDALQRLNGEVEYDDDEEPEEPAEIFNDLANALGSDHPLVQQFIDDWRESGLDDDEDVIGHLRARAQAEAYELAVRQQHALAVRAQQAAQARDQWIAEDGAALEQALTRLDARTAGEVDRLAPLMMQVAETWAANDPHTFFGMEAGARVEALHRSARLIAKTESDSRIKQGVVGRVQGADGRWRQYEPDVRIDLADVLPQETKGQRVRREIKAAWAEDAQEQRARQGRRQAAEDAFRAQARAAVEAGARDRERDRGYVHLLAARDRRPG